MKTNPATRVCFVGSGPAALRHINILRAMADVEIVGVCDEDADSAGVAAHRAAAKPYTHLDVMLDVNDVDAVFLCPAQAGSGHVEENVLRRGLALFVEGPLTLSYGKAAWIAACAARKGLVAVVGHPWRYLDCIDRVEALLGGRRFRFVCGHWHGAATAALRGEARPAFGAVAHLVDLALCLLGPATRAYGVYGAADEAGACIGRADAGWSATLMFQSGAVAVFNSSPLPVASDVHVQLFGDGFELEIMRGRATAQFGGQDPIALQFGAPLQAQARDFIDAVRGVRNAVRCTFQQGADTLRVLEGVHRSALEGQPVALTQIASRPGPTLAWSR